MCMQNVSIFFCNTHKQLFQQATGETRATNSAKRGGLQKLRGIASGFPWNVKPSKCSKLFENHWKNSCSVVRRSVIVCWLKKSFKQRLIKHWIIIASSTTYRIAGICVTFVLLREKFNQALIRLECACVSLTKNSRCLCVIVCCKWFLAGKLNGHNCPLPTSKLNVV